LREVEKRRLFSKLKYPSLFEYAVKDLGYSEPEAARRISAMRLLRDVPEISKKVESGELTLTNMVLAQTTFAKERKAGRAFTVDKKIEVLSKLENCSTRKAKEIVAEISPEMKKRDELNFDSITDEVLRGKLLQLKGLLAHTNSNLTLMELLHKLCDGELERLLSAPKVKNAKIEQDRGVNNISQAEIRRQVWRRDKNKCTNCSSTYALEIDHIIPSAKGGPSTLKNIRLLCRSCNQRAAISHFGVKKIEKYLTKLR
jgi:hypothetical protein